MTEPLTAEDKHLLGLDAAIFGAAELIPFPRAVGLGFVRPEIDTLIALYEGDFARATFHGAQADAADDLELSIWLLGGAPHVVKLTSPPNAVVHTARQSSLACLTDRKDPDTHYIDLSVTGPVSVECEDGSGIVFIAGRDGVSCLPYAHTVYSLPAPVALTWDGHVWCEQCGDRWLASEVQARLAQPDAWLHAVAAGMAARLLEPDSPQDRVSLRRSVAGAKVIEILAAPRRWARQLDAAQVVLIQELALVEIDRLHAGLRELDESFDLDDESWIATLRSVCHRRDDVESARVLLAERDATATVDVALDAFDAEAGEFVASLPRVLEIDDERLWRVQRRDLDAWWAAIVARD